MEIFGIPVIFIVIIVIFVISNYYEEEKKRKEETAQIWNGIHTDMSKDAVRIKLGKPHRVWKAGTVEIWGYGTKDSDGLIRFHNDKVIAYEKPKEEYT